MDFDCEDIKPYLSGTTKGKVPAERGAQREELCFQKGFAHCKWHEPQETTYSRARELFSKQLREIGLDLSL